ncbi:MAG: hypothetical protein DSZ01_01020, partial [Gammaproteobacteria bacterium]
MIYRKLFVLASLLTLLAGAMAAPDKPLLMEGKRSLYQRVLAVLGASLVDQPGDSQAAVAVTPFSVYYVYERRQHDGREWLLVGGDRHGGVSGWLPTEDALAWNQGLTVVFRDPAGHDRVLLFRDEASLKSLMQEQDPAVYERLYAEAVEGELLPPELRPARGVLSLELRIVEEALHVLVQSHDPEAQTGDPVHRILLAQPVHEGGRVLGLDSLQEEVVRRVGGGHAVL